MTTAPDPPHHKTARLSCWFRTGHVDACSDTQSPSLLARRPAPLDLGAALEPSSPSPLDICNLRDRASLTRPHTRSTVLKSP